MIAVELLWIALGFVLLVGGGEALVRGAASIASIFGVSTLIIGVTVVAFGTSAPELAVNILAAIDGEGDISFGNIIGSNISNIGLILGLTALIRAVDVHPSIITREIPFMLVATLLMVVLAADQVLGGTGDNAFSRIDGALMAGLFVVFFVVTWRVAMGERRISKDPFIKEAVEEQSEEKPLAVGPAILCTVAGLVAVVIGGKFVVDSAVAVAEALNVSKAVIGLTIVAIGTSLPELATCIMAVRRGHTDLAMGNIVGSNIWNILLVLPVTVLVQPFKVPVGGLIDLGVMALITAALLPLALSKRSITRTEGGVLLLAYLSYMTWRTMTALGG
jgi:cation:H+ antiporter